MIVRYFNDLISLVDTVCRDLMGRWRVYGAVHVGRVFGLKRYSDGGGKLTEWDWKVVPYCSKVRETLLLKIRKPILAFVRVPNTKDDRIVFYVYYNSSLFRNDEVEEIINEFNEMIKNNLCVLEMRSG
jgi:hypothetical protein